MTAVYRSIFANCHKILRVRKKQVHCLPSRNYFTPAYQCLETWNKRHEEEAVKLAGKPNEFYIELVQKLKRDYRIWPFDVDSFLQSCATDGRNWIPEEIEELLAKLHATCDAFDIMDSSHHQALRLLLHNEHRNSLLKVITQPQDYGIFPDGYVANLIMDHYLTKEDYTSSAQVAAQLMLYEEFGDSLTQLFIICSCLKYAANADTNQGWIDYTPKVEEEPEDEVKVRYDYYPHPYFDDHFDLRDGSLLTGKTLAWCAGRCLPQGDMRLNSLLVGWAFYRKWEQLLQVVEAAQQGSEAGRVAPLTVSLVQEQLTAHCQDQALKESIVSALPAPYPDYDLLADLERLLAKHAAEQEPELIQKQETTYSTWAQVRADTLKELEQDDEKKEAMQKIKELKKELKEKEQLVYFFDNEDKIKVFLDKKDTPLVLPFEEYLPYHMTKTKKKTAEEDVDYVPPDIKGRSMS